MSPVRSVTHVSGPDILSLERAKGFEPSTPTLARSCSTPELHPRPNSGRAMAAGLSSTYAKRTEALQPSLSVHSHMVPLLWQSRPRAMKRAAIMDAYPNVYGAFHVTIATIRSASALL